MDSPPAGGAARTETPSSPGLAITKVSSHRFSSKWSGSACTSWSGSVAPRFSFRALARVAMALRVKDPALVRTLPMLLRSALGPNWKVPSPTPYPQVSGHP